MYYLYEIKNNINGKIYIGVHKTDTIDDGYMGSGKVIKAAIKKYGVENFTKTILETFDDKESMYAREREVVDDAFLAREDTYNLRCGGIGGFDHVNDGSEEHRARCRKAALKRLEEQGNPWSGRKTPGNFAINEYQREVASLAACAPESIEKKVKTFEKIKHQQGQRNSQAGTKWCVLENAENLDDRKKFRDIPDGWITTTEWKERKKNKRNGAYGRRWFNDGNRNFLLLQNDPMVKSLTKGRVMVVK